jgi:hypothetical protein
MHHTTPAIIHHQIIQQDPKPNHIPVILPNVRPQVRFLRIPTSTNQSSYHQQTEQILIPNPMPATQQTVVINPQSSIGNIFVRQKRPQQVFQQHQQPINGTHTLLTTTSMNQSSNQLAIAQRPRQLQSNNNNNNNNNKTPPGSVNLERSYQICQAVIQNSSNPNRQQLNNQLKVPNFMSQKKF